jgi:hypothetical protein
VTPCPALPCPALACSLSQSQHARKGRHGHLASIYTGRIKHHGSFSFSLRPPPSESDDTSSLVECSSRSIVSALISEADCYARGISYMRGSVWRWGRDEENVVVSIDDWLIN